MVFGQEDSSIRRLPRFYKYLLPLNRSDDEGEEVSPDIEHLFGFDVSVDCFPSPVTSIADLK